MTDDKKPIRSCFGDYPDCPCDDECVVSKECEVHANLKLTARNSCGLSDAECSEVDEWMKQEHKAALKAERERVRPEVWQFALLMEKKLQENDHKEHWSKCNQEYLLKRLDEEVQELHKCFFFYSPGDMNFFMDGQHEDKIPGEAADVANFAMMLWDNFGEKESLRGEP